jgi:hypothetical protein
MQIRIALLYGCHLISAGDRALVRCQDTLYDAGDFIPVKNLPSAAGGMAAREFVRESMRTLVSEDMRRWPSLARKFIAAGT